jgi:hypothetical protein
VSPRLWHSCGRHTYDALFARSEPHVRRIFDKRATLSKHYIACYVPLGREADVDAEVARWMRRAYRFGCQEHLKRR